MAVVAQIAAHIRPRQSLTVASMLESVQVKHCPDYARFGHKYEISYRAMDGRRFADVRFVNHEDIHLLPPGATLMNTAILTWENSNEIVAFVYLVLTEDKQVVARIKRYSAGNPDDEFYLPGGLEESGPGVHPLPITDVKGWGNPSREFNEDWL